jgi:hypothetical protein
MKPQRNKRRAEAADKRASDEHEKKRMRLEEQLLRQLR